MPILNGMASWPERVESEVVEQKIKPAGKKWPILTHACPQARVRVWVGERVGVRECACVGFGSSVLVVGSGVKVCGKNVYYALAMAQAAKSAVNL